MFSIPSSDENSSYGAEKSRMPKMSPPLLRESVHGTLGTYTSTNQLKDSENSFPNGQKSDDTELKKNATQWHGTTPVWVNKLKYTHYLLSTL